MHTLVNFEASNAELLEFFNGKINEVNTFDHNEHSYVGLTAVSDGLVYVFNGVYAFANLDDRVSHIIVADSPKRLGILVIDTRKAHKKIVQKIDEFLKAVHGLTIRLSQEKVIESKKLYGHKLEDIKEQLIINNSLQ